MGLSNYWERNKPFIPRGLRIKLASKGSKRKLKSQKRVIRLEKRCVSCIFQTPASHVLVFFFFFSSTTCLALGRRRRSFRRSLPKQNREVENVLQGHKTFFSFGWKEEPDRPVGEGLVRGATTPVLLEIRSERRRRKKNDPRESLCRHRQRKKWFKVALRQKASLDISFLPTFETQFWYRKWDLFRSDYTAFLLNPSPWSDFFVFQTVIRDVF